MKYPIARLPCVNRDEQPPFGRLFLQEFRKIRGAYQILSKPKTRAEYDATRQSKYSWEGLTKPVPKHS